MIRGFLVALYGQELETKLGSIHDWHPCTSSLPNWCDTLKPEEHSLTMIADIAISSTMKKLYLGLSNSCSGLTDSSDKSGGGWQQQHLLKLSFSSDKDQSGVLMIETVDWITSTLLY